MQPVTRREIFRLSATGTLAALLAACGINRPAAAPAPQSPAGPAAGETPVSPTVAAAPTEATAGESAMAEGASGTTHVAPVKAGEMRVTPNEDFYKVDIGRGTPKINPATYRLRIFGLVDNELSLSLDDLKTMSSGTLMRTMECISNPVGGDLIGNAVWDVVPFATILEKAAPKGGSVEIITRGADGFHTSIPIELARDPEAFLAFGMNGEPLPPDHGFPVRCLWPGRYGMKQPKWLTEIEVTDKPYTGYWERQGWSNIAAIKVNSQIEQPTALEPITIGTPVTVSGRAMAGRSGVKKVEVSTDNGETWHEAELTQVKTPLVWALWTYTWETGDLPPGRHVLQARATDGDGVTQAGVGGGLLGGTFPEGTSRIHAVVVTLES
ncbi:MAG: molybdopterin-dependent oxidoreductase [Ardenticatenaceae bacterium]|nr:molybdopterin-dependent oxidoreductase [Ardenticatenaceae bacterium]